MGDRRSRRASSRKSSAGPCRKHGAGPWQGRAGGHTISPVRTHIRFAWFRIARGAAIVALAWCTLVTHAVLMIGLTWRWAFEDEPYSVLGAVMLSALILGFVVAAAIVVRSLGRPAETGPATAIDEPPDAFLLFPEEAPAENEFVLAPHSLATRRKALL